MPYHAIRDPDQIQALLDAVLDIESDLELPAVLFRIVEAACSADQCPLRGPRCHRSVGSHLSEFIHLGMDAETVAGIDPLPVGEGILGLLARSAPLRLADLSAHPDSGGFPPGHPPMRSFLGVPSGSGMRSSGTCISPTSTEARSPAEDEALTSALAAAAGIAVHNARLHARLGELSLATDRERIARDLHDTVIQRLFATGLSLQSAMPTIHDPELHARVEEAVSELDDTIRQVRTTIFALDPPVAAEKGVRTRVIEVCAPPPASASSPRFASSAPSTVRSTGSSPPSCSPPCGRPSPTWSATPGPTMPRSSCPSTTASACVSPPTTGAGIGAEAGQADGRPGTGQPGRPAGPSVVRSPWRRIRWRHRPLVVGSPATVTSEPRILVATPPPGPRDRAKDARRDDGVRPGHVETSTVPPRSGPRARCCREPVGRDSWRAGTRMAMDAGQEETGDGCEQCDGGELGEGVGLEQQAPDASPERRSAPWLRQPYRRASPWAGPWP